MNTCEKPKLVRSAPCLFVRESSKETSSNTFDFNNSSISYTCAYDQRYENVNNNNDIYRTKTRTFHTRWYILIIFSFYASTQYLIWNTFGPISSSAKKAFDWTNGDIATLANWDTILFILLSLQICWLIQKHGLRLSFLISMLIVVLGGIFRCVAPSTKKPIWLMNTGQIFNALGGMLAQSAGPFISNTWFPPHERTRATAIASLSSPTGIALSFIIGPLMVPDLSIDEFSDKQTMKEGVEHLLFLQCGVTVALFFMSIIYFPNKPSLPPSLTASLPKFQFAEGFKKLIYKKDFWLLLYVAASVTGIYSGWSAVMTLNFQEHKLNVTQVTCGWIGFVATLVSVAGGVLVGFLSDKYPGNIKKLLLLLYTVASLNFMWITLICNKTIPFNIGSIYTACSIGGFCINGSIPLLFELTIESTYPIPETISIGCISVVNNIFTFGFLTLLNVSQIGVEWMNWTLVGVCFTSVVLLFFFKESYRRSFIDAQSTDVRVSFELPEVRGRAGAHTKSVEITVV